MVGHAKQLLRKQYADEFINIGLEKRRIIKELQYFWYQKLNEL